MHWHIVALTVSANLLIASSAACAQVACAQIHGEPLKGTGVAADDVTSLLQVRRAVVIDRDPGHSHSDPENSSDRPSNVDAEMDILGEASDDLFADENTTTSELIVGDNNSAGENESAGGNESAGDNKSALENTTMGKGASRRRVRVDVHCDIDGCHVTPMVVKDHSEDHSEHHHNASGNGSKHHNLGRHALASGKGKIGMQCNAEGTQCSVGIIPADTKPGGKVVTGYHSEQKGSSGPDGVKKEKETVNKEKGPVPKGPLKVGMRCDEDGCSVGLVPKSMKTELEALAKGGKIGARCKDGNCDIGITVDDADHKVEKKKKPKQKLGKFGWHCTNGECSLGRVPVK